MSPGHIQANGHWGGPPQANPDLHLTPAALPYSVVFYERDRPGRSLLALLGDSPPTPSASAGDWNVVPLPKRSAVTVWQGRQNLLRLAVPIVIGSNFDGQQPPSTEHTALLKAWRPDDDTDEPPVVKVQSPHDSVPYQGLAWVVDQIDWGDASGDQSGQRVMQKLTVTLLEYRADEKLSVEHVKQAPKKRTRTHVVKRGETLITIARKFKVNGGWQALGAAQHPPIRDPRKVRVGQKLTIPA